MNSSADDKKRWAILPPPSPEASAVSEDIHLDPKAGQLRERIREGRSKESDSPRSGRVSRRSAETATASKAAEQPPSAPRSKTNPVSAPEERAAELRRRYEGSRHSSSIQAIEPSDSDLPTERPSPFSERSPSRPRQGRRDQETLPAPEWDEE